MLTSKHTLFLDPLKQNLLRALEKKLSPLENALEGFVDETDGIPFLEKIEFSPLLDFSPKKRAARKTLCAELGRVLINLARQTAEGRKKVSDLFQNYMFDLNDQLAMVQSYCVQKRQNLEGRELEEINQVIELLIEWRGGLLLTGIGMAYDLTADTSEDVEEFKLRMSPDTQEVALKDTIEKRIAYVRETPLPEIKTRQDHLKLRLFGLDPQSLASATLTTSQSTATSEEATSSLSQPSKPERQSKGQKKKAKQKRKEQQTKAQASASGVHDQEGAENPEKANELAQLPQPMEEIISPQNSQEEQKRQELAQLEKAIQEKARRLEEISQTLETKEKKLTNAKASKQEELTALTNKLIGLQQTIQATEEEKQKAKAQLQQTIQSIKQQRQEATFNDRKTQLEEQLSSLQGELLKTQKEIERGRQEVVDLSGQQATAEAALLQTVIAQSQRESEEAARLQGIEEAQLRLQTETEAAQKIADEARSQMEGAMAELAQIQAEAKEAEKNLAKIQTEAEEAGKNLAQTQSEQSQRTADMERLTKNVAELTRKEAVARRHLTQIISRSKKTTQANTPQSLSAEPTEPTKKQEPPESGESQSSSQHGGSAITTSVTGTSTKINLDRLFGRLPSDSIVYSAHEVEQEAKYAHLNFRSILAALIPYSKTLSTQQQIACFLSEQFNGLSYDYFCQKFEEDFASQLKQKKVSCYEQLAFACQLAQGKEITSLDEAMDSVIEPETINNLIEILIACSFMNRQIYQNLLAGGRNEQNYSLRYDVKLIVKSIESTYDNPMINKPSFLQEAPAFIAAPSCPPPRPPLPPAPPMTYPAVTPPMMMSVGYPYTSIFAPPIIPMMPAGVMIGIPPQPPVVTPPQLSQLVQLQREQKKSEAEQLALANEFR